MNPRSEILEAVESLRQEALELLQAILRTPSLTGEERQCQEILAERMHAMGLKVDMWEPSDEELAAHPAYVPVEMPYAGRPNVVGILRGHGKGSPLILNGRVDVVPTGPDGTWCRSPWSGHYEDGRVYGRGSADMKGGLVTSSLP